MTQEQVILLAREALKHDPGFAAWTLSTPHLEVIVNMAIKIEREACAKLCDEITERNKRTDAHAGWVLGNAECADAIRARGQ
jgi:hypothetical protein